eukprot:2878158-Prymnesium_polylepis.1
MPHSPLTQRLIISNLFSDSFSWMWVCRVVEPLAKGSCARPRPSRGRDGWRCTLNEHASPFRH